MKTIATINFKGGVGKTTVTWCLGDVLSTYSDSTVLLFDLDAQNSLTQSIEFGEGEGAKFRNWRKGSVETKNTIHAVLQKYLDGVEFDFQPDNKFIYKITDKYHFVPSTDDLYWMELKATRPEQTRVFVRRLVEKIKHAPGLPKYDYVIFDCPPSFTLLSYSVLTCCDLILIPVNPDFFAAKGVNLLITGLRKKIEPHPLPKIAVFANRVRTWRQPTLLARVWINQIKRICETASDQSGSDIHFLDAWIPDRASIRDAITNRQTPKELRNDFKHLWGQAEAILK